jgi:hypothetical protein
MSNDSDRAAIVVDKEMKDQPMKLLGAFASLLFRQKPSCHATDVKLRDVDRMSSSVSTFEVHVHGQASRSNTSSVPEMHSDTMGGGVVS